jgi:hypothetical protein
MFAVVEAVKKFLPLASGTLKFAPVPPKEYPITANKFGYAAVVYEVPSQRSHPAGGVPVA